MANALFLALRVIKQLAIDDGQQFPLALPVLCDNMYVDDLLFGADDIPQLKQVRDQIKALLSQGGFELRKWSSNSSSLLSDIDEVNHGLACHRSLESDQRLKILGINWNPLNDSFQFQVSKNDAVPGTKRAVLSSIAKLYDPLGWVTPVTIAAKVFMQQLWRLKLDWDEAIPSSLLPKWTSIYSALSSLNGLPIPRWTGLGTNTVHAELYGFADASNIAYAAIIYLKVVSTSGSVTITFLAGKSRVAPLNPISIPRLKLSATVLLSRLMEFIFTNLGFESLPGYCWTDSTIVLAWLRQHPSRWNTFVANRVAEIQTRTPQIKWHYVPTKDNPADCASRGLLGDKVTLHPLWWHDPSWLRLPKMTNSHGRPMILLRTPYVKCASHLYTVLNHQTYGILPQNIHRGPS